MVGIRLWILADYQYSVVLRRQLKCPQDVLGRWNRAGISQDALLDFGKQPKLIGEKFSPDWVKLLCEHSSIVKVP